jgi:uncharacterized membrane protein
VDFNLSEWLNLVVRWIHVFAAILWVGTTYYFTWLDGQLRRAAGPPSRNPGGALRRGLAEAPRNDRQREAEAGETETRVWMVHSGGFYTVQKQPSLGVPPSDIHWFRWEAMITWLSGLMLLVIVFYAGGLTIDPVATPVSEPVAITLGIASIIVGWVVYDALASSALARREQLFGAIAFGGILLWMALLSRVLSTRATYIHIGALFGTIMALNVWDRILPPQRKMIAAASRGESIDPSLGAGAKHRSKHNTFLAVPTTFIMISSHFPTATYGHTHGLVILGVLILVGWGAAAVLRRA